MLLKNPWKKRDEILLTLTNNIGSKIRAKDIVKDVQSRGMEFKGKTIKGKSITVGHSLNNKILKKFVDFEVMKGQKYYFLKVENE